jgi:hypothetical protein
MHKAWKKSNGRRNAVISTIYEINRIGVDIIWDRIGVDIIWEQGVGGSNPLAPTNNINYLRNSQKR